MLKDEHLFKVFVGVRNNVLVMVKKHSALCLVEP